MGNKPNSEWYEQISLKKGIPTRCPFVSVYRCPRYYQSLSLLGKYGSTEIPPEKDKKLKNKWEKSDFWPITLEQATSVSGGPDKYNFSKFCPEVLYERFGLFAEELIPHRDEYTLERLIQLKGPHRDNWEYVWAHMKKLHHSNCPLYSGLLKEEKESDELKFPDEIFEFKPNISGIGINLKALINRFCIWWLKKNKKR